MYVKSLKSSSSPRIVGEQWRVAVGSALQSMVACSVCRGWPRARRSFPLSRGPVEGSVEGVSGEAELA